MSGINISYNNTNPIGRIIGESNFEEMLTDDSRESAKLIVGEVVNEILDNAVEIVMSKSAKKTQMEGQRTYEYTDNPYNVTHTSPAIREIIDGLSNIKVNTNKAEEPLPLDMEMKRLLNEMMSPPYDILNYDAGGPRKDGVGDQPVDIGRAEEAISVLTDPKDAKLNTKPLEKKSRVTDLVMNSKQVLSNLLDDEAKKKQEEWETIEEKELRVIELQEHPFLAYQEEGEAKVNKNTSLDALDVSAQAFRNEESLIETASATQVGEGDKVDCSNNIADNGGAKDVKAKKSAEKKKKWGFMYKLLGIKKKGRSKEDNSVSSPISNA